MDPRFRGGDGQDDFHSLGWAAGPWVQLGMTHQEGFPMACEGSALRRLAGISR